MPGWDKSRPAHFRFYVTVGINHRTNMRINNTVDHVGLAANLYDFNTAFGRHPFIVVPIFVFGEVFKPDLIPVEHISIHIGYAPAYFLVITDHYIGRAGYGYTVNVYAG